MNERVFVQQKVANDMQSATTGDPSATRTRDTLIKSQVLCQLS